MTKNNQKPNIIIILADDLGYSDLGCYGSEIKTPNIDSLGNNGIKFSQFYNQARCSPSRASLMTGLTGHQAGVGQLSGDLGAPGYRGFINNECVTVAEVLKQQNYDTYLSGKWHLGGAWDPREKEKWQAGTPNHPTPKQRGFDDFYGIMDAASSFFRPESLMDGDKFIDIDDPDYYFTDAMSDRACEMITKSMNDENPFFLYLSYTAPHWPLHAKPEDIAKYEGKYLKGWDYFRTARHEEMKGLGIVDSNWDISPRDSDVGDWEDAQYPDWEDSKMAAYSAMIDSMDQGIGRVVETLKLNNQFENTLIFFMSDNGGCAELMREDGDWSNTSQWETNLINGKPVRVGNIPNLRPGPGTTFQSYETPWTNVSNSPFRLFKRWIHEGGISAPLIVHWPDEIVEPRIESEPLHIMDIPATSIDAAGAVYPSEFNGNKIKPIEGESFLNLLSNKWSREKPMYWEHEGNQGIRIGEWKLVKEYGGEWELYNMIDDRTELNNLAAKDTDRVNDMSSKWEEWAKNSNVLQWPVDPNVMAKRLEGEHSHIHQHRGATASQIAEGKGKFL